MSYMDVVYSTEVHDILKKSGLKEMDVEIYILRYGMDWFYADIGEYIGHKYRGKTLTEGCIRYRIKKIQNKLEVFVRENQSN